MRASPSRRGRCELSRVELRSELRRSEFRQSEFRQAELRRCELPASRRASTRASPTRAFPARMTSASRMPSAARLRRAGGEADQGFEFFADEPAQDYGQRAAERSAAAAASLRRHLRSAAADLARLDRPGAPRRRRISTRASGSMPISSTRVRRFRARRPRQVRHDVQGPQRLHGRQRAARRHRSRRRLGLRLQAERRRAWQRAAALGHGRQPPGQGASRCSLAARNFPTKTS